MINIFNKSKINLSIKTDNENNSPKYRIYDKRLRNKCTMTCLGKKSSLLGERASVRVKRVTHAREG